MQPGHVAGVRMRDKPRKNKGFWRSAASRRLSQTPCNGVPILNQPDHPQAFDFRGAVALVTGSGRGLGRLIAETLLNGGAAMDRQDINEEAPAALCASPNLSRLAEHWAKSVPGAWGGI